MTTEFLKISALTPGQAAKILAAAYGRRISEEQVRQITEAGQLLRADDTLSLIDYVAYLAQEAVHG